MQSARVGEGEVAFFSAKRWDRRNRADLIESATPCHDAQVVGPYWDSNPLRLTILAAMSEDYTTAPQHLQGFYFAMPRNVVEKIVVLYFWPRLYGIKCRTIFLRHTVQF